MPGLKTFPRQIYENTEQFAQQGIYKNLAFSIWCLA